MTTNACLAPSYTGPNGPLRSVPETLAPLDQLADRSASLIRKPLPPFVRHGREHFIPRYLFIGSRGGAEPVRVGIFAAVHGDQPEGTFALAEFIQSLDQLPEAAKGFLLYLYPIANPTGFESGSHLTSEGVNIPGNIWKNTNSPETLALQSELWMHGFDGLISIYSSPETTELSVAIGGPIFARHLLGTALGKAQDVLPQQVNAARDALPPVQSALLEEPSELIRAAPGLKPRPFEVVLTIPQKAPAYLQKTAVSLLLESVLSEYRKFISFGANL